MNRPKVYVTQATPHDLTPASKFGELSVLLKSTRDHSHATREMLQQFHEGLRDFSDQDFLILVGDPVAMTIAVNVAAEVNEGRVKLLKWSRKYTDYVPIEVDFFDFTT